MRRVYRIFILLLIVGVYPAWTTAQVPGALHTRNYQNCLLGLYGCDSSRLTPEEQQSVTVAAHSRNYQNCLLGLYGCNQTLLTDQEKVEVASTPNARPAESSKATVSTTAPACEENGSCYGDISDKTGRPKTVDVHGYYRKDGTYVRGHYRSAPVR
jgi:hypothetical protein